jgi:hypothetical protein
MNRKNLLNLILLIFVAGLATIIINSKQDNSNELPRLTDIDTDSINSITIRHNDNITAINKDRAGRWLIKKPIEIAANSFRINSILKLLNAPIHNRYPLSQIGMQKFRGNTKASIDAETGERIASGTSIQFDDHTITFGITNPSTKLRFILLDDTVYTIEDFYAPLITSHFGTLVSLNLLPKNSHIEKLTLLNQTINKDEKGRWQSSIDMDADTVSETLDAWKSTQAFGIHAYMQRTADNRQPVSKVSVQLNSKTIDFIISDTDPWVILARPMIGLEYHLDKEAYDRLLAPQ